MKESHQLGLILAAALAAGGLIYMLADNGRPAKVDWGVYLLAALGSFSLLNAVLDRAQKPDFKRINRVEGIKFLLGPLGSRLLFGTIGGAMLGGAIALFTS